MEPVTDPSRRPRSRRGDGAALRAEILAAAGRLLDETGRDEAITLRAVARSVGISAPSIYPHFAEREAIVVALIQQSFADLIDAVDAAISAFEDSVERLHAGCDAYLDYAAAFPHRYTLMFEMPREYALLTGAGNEPQGKSDVAMRAFAVLVEAVAACARAGRSDSTDPFFDATALWVGLHGYATLRAGDRPFVWPVQSVPDHLIDALARVVPPAPA